ncbi:MAG TPA: DUF58 domain-containing protein [Spirochaetia bacterium]|nr:DUF58 domain-containing protein [Spirochaetia bacterium]
MIGMTRKRHGSFLLLTIALFLIVPHFLIQFILLLYILVNLFSLLHSTLTSRLLRVTRNFTTAWTYRGEQVNITVSITNRSLFTAHNLFAVDSAGKLFLRGESSGLFTLRARQTARLSFGVFGDKRGIYTLGPLRLSGADPLALYPWSMTVQEAATVVIYPHVFPLRLPIDRGLPSGTIPVFDPAYEDITSFRSIREYLPGDSLRRVNWKVSARLGSLFTMQYTPSLSFQAVVLLNLLEEDYPLRYRHTIIEYSIEIAASLVHAAIAAGQNAGLFTYGRIDSDTGPLNFPVHKEAGHGMHILETLARVASTPRKKDFIDLFMASRISLPFASRVWYVGPPLETAQLDRLRVLKRHGITVEFFPTAREHEFSERLSQDEFPCHHIDELRNAHAT